MIRDSYTHEDLLAIPDEPPLFDDDVSAILSGIEGRPALRKLRSKDNDDEVFCSFTNPFERKSPAQKTAEQFATAVVKEVQQKLFELTEVDRQLEHPETEAAFTPWTEKALAKDADLYKPVKNPDGSTTYTIVLTGLSDRTMPGKNTDAVEPYMRKAEVTVPAGATNFRNCKVQYEPRQPLTEEDYTKQLERDKARQLELTGSKELAFYTHGILTSPDAADVQALMLELTHGHPVINIDWKARPMPADFSDKGVLDKQKLYQQERSTAADSGPKFDRLLDKSIDIIGAENTTMIGYSHGAMIDTRYLSHRADQEKPKLHSVVLTHADVPNNSAELVVWRNIFRPKGLLAESTERAFVIGSTKDFPLKVASLNDYNSPRLGNDDPGTRSLAVWAGAMPITERPRHDKKDAQHFVNYTAIAELMHAEKTDTTAQLQARYDKVSDQARWRWYKRAVKTGTR